MWQIYKNLISGSFVLLLFTTFLYSDNSFEELKSSAQKNQKIVKLSKDILKSFQDGEFNSHKLYLLKTNEKGASVRISPLAKSSSPQNTSSETLVEKWESNAWVNDALYLDTFADDGTYIEGISQDWTGSAWINDWKTTYSYLGGNMTEMIDQQWNGSAWVNSMKFSWVYDGNGNNIETTIYMWENNGWVGFSKTIDTYDGNQYLITSENKSWDAGTSTWVDFYLTTYTNDGSGNPTVSVDQMWLGTVWMNISKSTYTYSSGLLVEELSQDWDMISSVWKDSGKDLYTYDGNQNQTELIRQEWDGVSSWTNVTRLADTYTANLWVESLRQNWEGSQWVNFKLQTFTYDGQSRITVWLWQNWENNAWVNNSRWTTTYGGTAIDDVNPIVLSEMQLSQNYPNPFNPTTTINYHLSAVSQVNLSVFNASGQEVRTLVNRRQDTGKHSVKFNASGLASGIYYYKLSAGSFVQARKLILLK